MYRQVNLACQGVITRNNHALELARYFIPKGEILFLHLKGYERFLMEADLPLSFHPYGRMLIQLLPFLKAYGATNQRIEEYATVHISLVPGAKGFFDHLLPQLPCFLQTSAYTPFVISLCLLLGLQETNVFSTPLNLDQYPVSESEREMIKDLADEIVKMPPSLRNTGRASSLAGAGRGELPYLERLRVILEEEIPNMEIAKKMDGISPQAGEGKIEAIKKSLEKSGNLPEEVLYFGSSSFDVKAMEWIRRRGGLAISFNGDRDAASVAEIAIIGGNCLILALLGDAFARGGKASVIELIEHWNIQEIQGDPFVGHQTLINQFFSHGLDSFPRLELVTESNCRRIMNESEAFRSNILGIMN